MTNRTPPKLATALLTRLGPPNAALAGDLREALVMGRSVWWYWKQVLAAVWILAVSVVIAAAFGLIVSVGMSRASNLSPVWNLLLGGAFVLVLALAVFLAVLYVERKAFG